MKLTEAIVFNQALEKDLRAKGMPTFAKATQLGVEAIKRDLTNRLIDNHPDQALLPGETKE